MAWLARTIVLATLAIAIVLGADSARPQQATACSVSWLDPVDGDWEDPTRWSTGSVPEEFGSVCIDVDGTYTVTLNSSVMVSELAIGGLVPGGQRLVVRGSSGGATELNVLSMVTNNGTTVLDGSGGGDAVILASMLYNTAAGTLRAAAGGSGARVIGASVYNEGAVEIEADTAIDRSGALVQNYGSFHIGADATLTIDNEESGFSQTDGTLDVEGDLALANGSFFFNGGTISGTPVITDSVLHLNTDAALTIGARGTTTLEGDIGAEQTIVVHDFAGAGALTKQYSTFLRNSGTLILESTEGPSTIELMPLGGAIHNLGVLRIDNGSGGTRRIGARLLNEGTVQIRRSTVVDDGDSGSGIFVQNLGTLHIDSGAVLSLQGTDPYFGQSDGSLDGSLAIENGTFYFAGGTITGTPVLTDSRLNLQHPEPATFEVRGTTTLEGSVAAGQTLLVRDAGGVATLQSTPFSGLQNDGTQAPPHS